MNSVSIDQKKFRALMWLLTPQNDGYSKSIVPWSQEKNRTFHCTCGQSRIIPEDSLIRKIVGKNDDGTDIETVSISMGKSTKCEKCGKENYELISLAHRYGLMQPKGEPRRPAKKAQDPMINFDATGTFFVKAGHE